MAKKTKIISEAEAKSILADAAREIQALDERIEELKEEKKFFIKDVKDAGISTTALAEAIRRIRKQKANKGFEDEVELYMESLSDNIFPLKN